MGPGRPMISRLALCFLAISTLSLAQESSVRPLVTQSVDESDLTTLKGNTLPLAQPRFDVGAALPTMLLDRMLLVLKRSPEQERALQTMLDNQQDKRSQQYHHWLTPDEFGRQFGLGDEDLRTITGWLQSHGFEINRVSHGRTVIEFSGAEGQVEAAFHTSIHRYLANGEEHWANASDPQIPAALAPAVAGVWSLDDFRKKPNIRIWPETLTTKYTPRKRPATTLSSSNGTIYALSPADYATIYNIYPLYGTGLGRGTIAVVARSDLYAGGSDVQNFWQVFGVQGGILNIVNDGPDPGDLGGSEEFEATLDASWSGAIAPLTTVDFVVSSSTNTTDGVDLSELYIIDNNLAPVMTESFGTCDTLATAVEAQADSQLAEQAAAQGISYVVSSGDSGAAGCDDPTLAPAIGGAAVNLLGTPYNLVVGGTQFNENGNDGQYWSSTNQNNEESALSYIPEDAWNESCQGCQFPNLYASGGGASKYYASKPPWQSGVTGIPNDGVRDQPDVALTAAAGHDPYIVCLEASCIPDSKGNISLYLVGGTSASAPSFAGIMNLVDLRNGGPQGQANYVLYGLAAAENNSFSQCNASNTATPPAATCVFNDVTSGDNSVPGQSGFSAATGYDLATGLGSVNVSNLVNKWSSLTFRATTTTLGPGPITGTHGSPVTLQVSVAPNTPPGTPTGDVSLVTSNQQSGTVPMVGFLTLNNGSQSAAINYLPGGSYTLTAQYGGDATFKPSPPSNRVSVNISPESSQTTLSLLTFGQHGSLIPFPGGPYGRFVYLGADVAGNSGAGVPTGSVSFTDSANGTTTHLGSLNLNAKGMATTPGGYFYFTTGSHSIVAQYAGDPSFKASSSSAAVFSITKASTATTLSPVSGVVVGTAVTLNANVSSPAFAGWGGSCGGFTCETSVEYPDRFVTFFAGTKQLAPAVPVFTPQITANGVMVVASLTTSALPAGQNAITAQYSGDPNYLASAASAITVGVDADFGIAAASASIAVTGPGGNTTNSLTITGQTGYNSTINFSSASCNGLPALSRCSFSPASLTGSGSTKVTIQTTAPTSATLRPPKWTGMGLVFAGVLLWGVPRRRLQVVLGMSFLLLGLASGSVGCGGVSNGGGNTSNPGTPLGSYNLVVTATTSDNVISHTTNFTLVVE